RKVFPVFRASSMELAPYCSSGHDAILSCDCARGMFRSATAATCMPTVVRAWARNIVPNLPAPIWPMRIGLPAAARSLSMNERFTGDYLLRSSCAGQNAAQADQDGKPQTEGGRGA